MDGFRPMRRANPILFALPTKRKAFRPPPPKLKEGWRAAILSGGVTPVWVAHIVNDGYIWGSSLIIFCEKLTSRAISFTQDI